MRLLPQTCKIIERGLLFAVLEWREKRGPDARWESDSTGLCVSGLKRDSR